MKRLLVPLLVLVALGGGYAAAVHFSGGAFYDFGVPLGGDLGELRRTTTSFWEDLQFKDFQSAALYHAPEQRDTVDIPYLLERLFLVKPEALDIMEYEIVLAEVDSSGLRARIKTRVKFKELVRGKIDETELMLYYHRESVDSPWYMKLESSLRALDADEEKKH